MHDVIVVGGGPAGSYTALKLAQKGYKVQVLEAQAGAGFKASCTGIVGQEFVDTYQIPLKLILRQANSARLYSPSGNALHIYRKENQACILDRAAFDVWMAEQAQAAGASYEFNCRVTDISIEPGRAGVTVSRNGAESKIPSKAVVLACGYNPGLNERAGLGGFKVSAAGAQAEVAAPGLEEVQVYTGDTAPGFFAWLVPTTPGMARAGLLTRRDPGKYLKAMLEKLYKTGKITTKDPEISYGAIPLKPPARTYGDRLVAVGDAAGQTKPTSGGGLYYGLIGADAAAATLAKALNDGDLSAGRLGEYEKAWRGKLGREMRHGYWARRLYERLSDKQIDLAFKIMKAGGMEKALLNAREVSFDWHSRTIKSVLRYQALNLIKSPFRGGGAAKD